MAILIVAEHDHASLSDQTAKAVSAATQIGGDIHVLVAGKDAKAAADAAAKLDGVSKVLHAEGDEYANRLAEPLAALVVSLADGYDTLMAPATTSGKNVMPRVAALLDVMQISDIIEVIAADTSSVRSMPATPCRRSSRPTPSASSRAHRILLGSR
jgi:electron transfer flavoprotein alpha subunit